MTDHFGESTNKSQLSCSLSKNKRPCVLKKKKKERKKGKAIKREGERKRGALPLSVWWPIITVCCLAPGQH